MSMCVLEEKPLVTGETVEGAGDRATWRQMIRRGDPRWAHARSPSPLVSIWSLSYGSAAPAQYQAGRLSLSCPTTPRRKFYSPGNTLTQVLRKIF